jgi:hypothetical protein
MANDTSEMIVINEENKMTSVIEERWKKLSEGVQSGDMNSKQNVWEKQSSCQRY